MVVWDVDSRASPLPLKDPREAAVDRDRSGGGGTSRLA
jgi:hypothetical protein